MAVEGWVLIRVLHVVKSVEHRREAWHDFDHLLAERRLLQRQRFQFANSLTQQRQPFLAVAMTIFLLSLDAIVPDMDSLLPF